MKKPLVSVIMTTYNQAHLIGKAIESVLSQTFEDFEFIIVNDGSTDNTEKVIKGFNDPRIIYLNNGKNLGVPKSFNSAIKISQGKYIARIDSDDFWSNKNKLKKQVEFLETHPEYVAVGGGMIVVDSEGKELYRYLKPEKDEEIRKNALITNPIANSTSLCRRETIFQIGLCDESFGYNEDWDFWLKIGLKGKLYNFPEYFAYYTLTYQNKSLIYLRKHTLSALRIIFRHRHNYPNFLKGFLVNFGQFLYSLVPLQIRVKLHPTLSRFKKILAGSPTG